MGPALALTLVVASAAPPAPTVASAAPPAPIVVAAAADLRFALPAVVEAFAAQHPGIRVEVVSGSSGAFFAQVGRGAPFDVFLSADVDYVDRLVAAGHAEERFIYGHGRLVLYSAPGAPVSAGGGVAVVADPRVTRIAIAHPRHAPYGRAAEAALRQLGLQDAVRPKLVLGESVAQAAHFVDSGAAELGFIPLAFVLSPSWQGRGAWVEVPAGTYPPLVQGGCVVKTTRQPQAARAFRDFLLGDKARAILARSGFLVPRGDRAAPSSSATASSNTASSDPASPPPP
jgi:molybdate transport system substrate-binding protein